MQPTLFAVAALSAPPPPGWRVRNSTNLRYGDGRGLDFGLPPGTTDAQGIAACTEHCAREAACAAWVYVRSPRPRCALKGHRTGWCGPVNDTDTVSGIKPGVNATACGGPKPAPPLPPGAWRLPAIDWAAGGVVGPMDQYAVRAFDVVQWEDGTWYMYSDLVRFDNPECPSSFGSEIGVFSAADLDSPWSFHGIAVHKNHSAADAGGLATPTAVVNNGRVYVYFAYEGLPVGGGERGIGGAWATHPLGPFVRTPPVAMAPKGWHRPTGPGGILDDPEALVYRGTFHLFHSRKHVERGDTSCAVDPQAPVWQDHCVEWRTSRDGIAWQPMGILNASRMSETMSARIYPNDTLVVMTDGDGMQAFTTAASRLAAAESAAELDPWTALGPVNQRAGLNSSFVNVALRILPDGPAPTHAAMGWRPAERRLGGACHGAMTFAVFPLE